jgi:2-iminobutanoate/2-iminopropanoate deaminase
MDLGSQTKSPIYFNEIIYRARYITRSETECGFLERRDKRRDKYIDERIDEFKEVKKVKKIIRTDRAPKPVGPYSQAVRVGNILYCSGQVAIDPTTNEINLGDIQTQSRIVMSNIKAVLEEAGATFENVVKTTIFLKSMNDFSAVNEIYGSYFKDQPPARSTIEVAGLPKGASVEIEVIAAFN